MSAASLITRHALSSALRDRSILLLLGFFAVMVMVTAWLGWSATTTVNAIYADAVSYLSVSGQIVPPNPIGETAPLSVLRNLGVYISLVGGFAAIVLGQLVIEADRRAGTLPLIATRPLTRSAFMRGKIYAVLIATGVMISITAVISLVTLLLIPALAITGLDLAHLALFFLISWAYLVVFGLVALGAAARISTTAGGLIAACVLWLVIGFVMPELTANVHPTAAINPISTLAPTPQTALFAVMSQVLGPFSLSESFAWLSGDLLAFLPDGLPPRGPVPPILSIFCAMAGALIFAVLSGRALDVTAGGPDA